MLQVTKHRRLCWVVTTSAVVAAICLVVAVLATLQRRQVIAQLEQRILSGSDAQASAAVLRLASMPHPPASHLASAASSPRRAVAVEAQQAISDLIRRWQRRIKTGHSRHRVAVDVEALAAALAEERENFLRKDHRWVEKTARKLVRLSDQLAEDVSPNMAVQCDLLLASLGSTELAKVGATELAIRPNSPNSEVDSAEEPVLRTASPPLQPVPLRPSADRR